jgi:chromosome segregation ATPase
MRDEFSKKYDHDKSVMVEALDKMVTENLTTEITEFQEEKKQLELDRAKFSTRMVESANKFDKFMAKQLAEEVKELRNDRRTYENSIAKLEKFVVSTLAEEIQEFEQDKKAVVETKVRLVAEAKSKMAELKENFINKSAALVKEAVSSKLESELAQLKEDITIARENMFGRKIFEAVASEFAVTHLNENKEIAKLHARLDADKQKIAEATNAISEANTLVEAKNKEIRIIKDSQERKNSLTSLLKPLNKEKAAVMSELLESVETKKLASQFDKYLPAVLGGTNSVKTAKVVTEAVEATGNKKSVSPSVEAEDSGAFATVIELKKLAGLR